jgi:hypothetical protein
MSDTLNRTLARSLNRHPCSDTLNRHPCSDTLNRHPYSDTLNRHPYSDTLNRPTSIGHVAATIPLAGNTQLPIDSAESFTRTGQ